MFSVVRVRLLTQQVLNALDILKAYYIDMLLDLYPI